MDQALLFLITAVADLYLMVLLLRFVLQLFRANFRNPIAQAVLRLTSPVVMPLRRIISPIGKVDTASIVAALLFEVLFVILIALIYGLPVDAVNTVLYAAVRTLLVLLRLFLFAIFIYVILSWIAAASYNPVTEVLGAVSEPLLAPARRILPPIAGLDLSPIAVLLLLQATIIIVGQGLPSWLA